MSSIAIGLVSILYLVAAFGYYKAGKHGLAMAFVCYSLANIGLIMEGKI